MTITTIDAARSLTERSDELDRRIHALAAEVDAFAEQAHRELDAGVTAARREELRAQARALRAANEHLIGELEALEAAQ
jgi:hypothetical protein